jgi:hypothetical protein
LAAVKRDGTTIQHIVDPSEKVQIAAVKQNPTAIQHIKNPCVFVRLIGKYE